ncbi:MAG: phosphatidate cytidylyltransferase [Verrucomicrobiia bacterium]|jgi:phosphatidate cytidylyltransferase
MDTDSKIQSQSEKGAVFLKRFGTTIALWGIVLSAIFAPSRTIAIASFLIIALALSGIGLYEFYNLIQRRGLQCLKSVGIIAGSILVCVGFLKESFLQTELNFEPEFLLLAFIAIVLFTIRLSLPLKDNGFVIIATTLLGIIYVPFLFLFIQKIYFYPKINGQYYLLLFLLLTKFSDSGAYIFGSLFGKHKMSPTISPKKTWEGFVGAILLPVLVALILYGLAGKSLTKMTIPHLIVLSILLGAAAVVGDLIESVFKRESDVKDSGNLFPGVGGVLDVLDSLLFNAPIMYFYMRFVMNL